MNTEQQIKQHICTYSKRITGEVGDQLGMKFESHALDLIAELTYKKLSLYGADLEAFAKHARRSMVTADDVKLLVRRNDSLKKLVDEKAQRLQENKPPEATGSVKRKRKTTNSTS
ncbi:centromere protein S [Dendroctonus ponderosae]|uniref:centromere protein S n=1 Tax=Dendroctonus ponderosae TaxID=77166 RepID=UPI0020356C24|nr:centromere protein S [Dendroctonus ponderosae]XP_019763111.2 centromere protein S [Dendroctonus ponderosae]XP_048524052.1 centromere protein S [Dendroctonus ponderosae]XP_048524053.1 centromere protein S [Dendroctonus ponderosae]KAH1012749.1 hypothetical protein HUJ05_011848 [Dendroctonus ponderosae]